MRKNLFTWGLFFAALLFSGCGDDTHGGSGDNEEPEVDYPEGSLLNVALNPEEDGINYYATDGETDIAVINDPETGRPVLAVVSDRVTEDHFGILFSEEGYPLLYIHDDTYFVLNNFSGTQADMAVIDETGEIMVYRNMETGVDWDDGFYAFLNDPVSTRSIDWKRLGNAFYEELKEDGRLLLIGIGYGIKAIPSMMSMRTGDPTAFIDFASNFVDMLDEAIPDNRYIQTTKLALEGGSLGSAVRNIVKCRTDVSYCLSNTLSGMSGLVGDYISDIGRPETEMNIMLGDHILISGYGEIKVTLTWNNVNDIDLHVIDPNGEEIYWNHKNSASGGKLDYDNRVSHGPENIYWPEAKLTGNYLVEVHHYEGTTAANYSVYINAFGRSKVVTGSISPEEMKLVAVFDETGISTDVRYLSKPVEKTAAVKGLPEASPYRRVKTGIPDLQQLRERFVRSPASLN
ncbi:MAG: hypothetical protein LBF85_03015 [Tannerella sp.]|nr:hypothetical protein [Tannerella sp.]